MRYTFSDIQTFFLQSTGNAGSTDATLLDFFKRSLNSRYQMAFSEITNRTTMKTKTGATVIGQQFYHYPPGMVTLEGATVTIGGIAYPVITEDSQLYWDYLNQTLLSVSALPRAVFPRRDDFGLWPIPQAVYTMTINYPLRDRALGVTDYVTGTVSVTNGSQTVTGSGATWTVAMINRWFVMNDSSQQGQGYWYRISNVSSTTSLTLESAYIDVSVSGANYKIGESPELPEEVHYNIAAGCISDYYAGPRGDPEKANWWNNLFWTGDGNNNERNGRIFTGGVLGAKERYAGRQDGAMVYKKGPSYTWQDRMWQSSIH